MGMRRVRLVKESLLAYYESMDMRPGAANSFPAGETARTLFPIYWDCILSANGLRPVIYTNGSTRPSVMPPAQARRQ